ncbi:MAG: SIMPL domain-containing protein [Acidobacteriota bacterium]|nr:SIMPL domain-containing protein [Acidobacteriota bacterium]
MNFIRVLAISAALAFALSASAQQASQPELKIDSANRTLTVTANESVSVEPDLAILHIGFETQPSDAKTAYATGARTSNAIIGALKDAGVAESAIRSQSQYLQRDYTEPKSHKFKLTQQWTVRTTPERAAEILDVAITAGANSSGAIDWTVKDERALEEQALNKAATRAQRNAAVLAKAIGVRLGALIYVSNQLSSPGPRPMAFNALAMARQGEPSPPLAIEPQKVMRAASVYAVYALQ